MRVWVTLMFQDVSPISYHLRAPKKSQQFEGLHLCDTISHPWVAINFHSQQIVLSLSSFHGTTFHISFKIKGQIPFLSNKTSTDVCVDHHKRWTFLMWTISKVGRFTKLSDKGWQEMGISKKQQNFILQMCPHYNVNLIIHWATNFQLPFFPFEPSHHIETSRIWSWPLPRPSPIFMEIYPNATFCLKQGHYFWGIQPRALTSRPKKLTNRGLVWSFSWLLLKWKKLRPY